MLKMAANMEVWKSQELLDALRSYFARLKVPDMAAAKNDVLPVVNKIVDFIKIKDRRFDMTVETRGSVYEKLKIDEADEFDFDLKLNTLKMEKIELVYADEYTVCKPNFWLDFIDEKGLLLTQKLTERFSSYVGEACREINSKFSLRSKLNHPAVTVFMSDGETKYNVDLALVIEVEKWPENLTLGWEHRKTNGFPSVTCIEKIKSGPICLVAKVPPDIKAQNPSVSDNLWRMAFNHAEKQIALDPNEGVPDSCRRPVLRILKGFREHLNWPFLRSYHIKTVLLHEFESHPPDKWQPDRLGERVFTAVKRLKDFVVNKKCPHYFLPQVNLFKTMSNSDALLQKIDRFLGDPLAMVRALNNEGTAPPTNDLQIYLRLPNGKTTTLSTKKNEDIQALKRKASTISGLAESQFYLSFNSRSLERGTIASNGIKHGSEIVIMTRLRGGT
ncbi:cyclic GMP-AMP synthase-like receptor 1 isoform X1 [Rhopilema esculentum]|uniref:cyclic GMP-AMP synthase-like receptor 1 isoform X1 n=1 Tax=Rhopilema esculentum TaxID=499914 RepID=UPI0031E0F93A